MLWLHQVVEAGLLSVLELIICQHLRPSQPSQRTVIVQIKKKKRHCYTINLRLEVLAFLDEV